MKDERKTQVRNNYEYAKEKIRPEFLKYDQETMIRRFQLKHDPDYIYLPFVGSELNILRWQSHPISRNRATGSVIESRSSDGGSHDLCRGSQYGDLAFDRSFPLPHGYFPVNPHGIGRWYDAVKDRIGKGTASQSFMPAFRHEL